MGSIEIGLVIVGLIFFSFGSALLFFAYRIYRDAVKFVESAQIKEPRKQKILVPGKGIFQTQKAKIKPIYKTDEEIWVQQENDRLRRES